MSVTFTIEANPTGAFVIDCDGETVATADSYDAIMTDRAAHMLACDECAHYGCYTQPVMDVSGEFDVNVSNVNARMLLAALGMDSSDDLAGDMDSTQFLGSVLLALGSDRDDSGVAAQNMFPGSPGATMIDCGLAPGYFAERFGALHALALEAVRLGRTVVWS